MAEKGTTRDILIKQGDSLIKTMGGLFTEGKGNKPHVLEQNEIIVLPEDEAVKIYVQAGLKDSEAYLRAAEEMQELYESKKGFLIKPNRVGRLFEMAGRAKEAEHWYALGGEKYGESIAYRGRGLERRFVGICSLGSLIASAFFLSPNVTGNIIFEIPKTNSNIAGMILFALGIVGLFFFFKKK